LLEGCEVVGTTDGETLGAVTVGVADGDAVGGLEGRRVGDLLGVMDGTLDVGETVGVVTLGLNDGAFVSGHSHNKVSIRAHGE
jgi:hypothetical protein